VTVHNFSAGPAMLPAVVRERLSEALAPDPAGRPSIAEVSHRGPVFAAIADELTQRLRGLMQLNDDQHLLLLQGGANLQFAWLPMVFGRDAMPAYLTSGHWGEKALAEARRIGPAEEVGTSKGSGFTELPEVGTLPPACAYLHYTGNETIHGVQFRQPPAVEAALAADLSSEFLSRPYPYDTLAFCYAGAQKNLGIPGLTVVVVRDDLLARLPDDLPAYLDFRRWIEADSMLNTPTTLAWFAALETCRWIESCGGLGFFERRNRARAARLYDAIDGSAFWSNPVAPSARSVMNVPFFPADIDRSADVVARAEAAGLLGLKGHRALGGLRASLYNALDDDAVESLIDFLGDYERRFS
jgi:phosphoserine aminotransferase